MPRAVALVPARAGSQRVPGKNVRVLAGHPLIAYTIAAALESELFDSVVVSTDSEEIAGIARDYGAEVPGLRPPQLATSTSPDIEWIHHTMATLEREGREFELFSLLRPTSPFRAAETIRQAMERLVSDPDADSIRAVERCRQHPGKMWVMDGEYMKPLLEGPPGEVPYHSRQYQSLPEVYAQNSSLEIARSGIIEDGEIAGKRVLPFVCDGPDGFSIDYPSDWEAAERMVETGEARLPAVHRQPLTSVRDGGGS